MFDDTISPPKGVSWKGFRPGGYGLLDVALFPIPKGLTGKRIDFFHEIGRFDSESEELALSPDSVKEGIRFLKTADLENLPLGTTKIDGDRVFANAMEYETHPGEEISESHKRYYDIQYMIRGQEMQACIPYTRNCRLRFPITKIKTIPSILRRPCRSGAMEAISHKNYRPFQRINHFRAR